MFPTWDFCLLVLAFLFFLATSLLRHIPALCNGCLENRSWCQESFCRLSPLPSGLCCPCRKGTLLINNIFAIVPAILMGVSKVAKAFELIIFSRVVVGVCAGTWSDS